MKKLFIFTLVMMFACSSIGFAAKGSVKPRMSAPRSAPAQQAPAPQYKPSAPANSYGDKAPAAAAKPAAPGAQQQPSSSGGLMRNLGMLGGGMLLGGMLGSLFGDSAMLASIFGMLFNVLIIAAIFMGGRLLWNKFRKKDEDKRDRRDF